MDALNDLIRLALDEDLGSGDWTTEALVPENQWGTAEAVAREPFVLAGLEVARRVFSTLSASSEFLEGKVDGENIVEGESVFTVHAPMRTLLTGERTALNFMQRLSGIATLTRRYVDRIEPGLGVRITDTRKTTPGWRSLEKYAVRIGGGANHRFGLYDGLLIKDNHIAACGGITEAVVLARRAAPHLLRIEVETTNLSEVREALDAGADVIMFDNMSEAEMRDASVLVGDRAIKEASGRMDLDHIAQVAATGVDLISVGKITHSARSVDISMRIEPD